ncbi:MAG: DNA internalization-related competence protein ComEC/Rec2, partial [Gammaproteobacteria bacterium]
VIRALAVADRSALDDARWQLVRDTGTAHLLAISGLHVALSAALAFGACRLLAGLAGWRHQAYPALRLAWLGAAAAACVYAGLAGFGVPARRAALMVVLAALAALCGRRVLSFDHLLVALAVMVTLDPFALLGAGLWLSFGAVVILFWSGFGSAATGAPWRRAWRVHLALACGMAPLLGAVFGALPLVAPLANLVAVPWCSVLVVPLVLAGILCAAPSPPLAALAWDMAGRLWGWLETFLALLAAPQLTAALDTLVPAALLPLALAVATFAVPRGLGLRRLGLVLLVTAALARAPPPPSGAFEAQVLDVGQGLAVLVRTARHTLLYDTGPRWWPSGDDAGRAVVVPALRRHGLGRVDTLVISHTDSDHVGGLDTLLATLPVGTVYAPPAAVLPGGIAARDCDGAADLRVDGVVLRWLATGAAGSATRNDGSCVLLVASAHGRL